VGKKKRSEGRREMAGRKEKAKIRKVIFDTDVLIWYFRGMEKAKNFLAQIPLEMKVMPSPVYMELLQGCLDKQEVKIVKQFVAQNFLAVIQPNQTISEKAISLVEKYSLSHGLRVIDALVASTALVSQSHLCTVNTKHYRFIKELKILPFEPE